MKRMRMITFTLLCLCYIFSCTKGNETSPSGNTYINEIRDWQEERISSLKEKESWLSLAGLYRLHQGMQTFGADSSHDIIFPPKAPSTIGTIHQEDSFFKMTIHPDVKVTREGESISSISLEDVSGEGPVELQHGSFIWYIIERRGQYYLRLKDTEHPNFSTFEGTEFFPIKRSWLEKATFQPLKQPQVITIPDIMGNTYQDTLYGTLEFSHNGKDFSLAPLGHPDHEDQLFLIFGDHSNGNSTYGGGRYLYLDSPNEEGVTYIDFNKSYNPPCVFTRFATCPLPPQQNRLPFKIPAGEKMYNAAISYSDTGNVTETSS